MPVTAKFSEEFYAKFGPQVVDEIVDWFNKVDLTLSKCVFVYKVRSITLVGSTPPKILVSTHLLT